MKPCELRDRYLDGGLVAQDASNFEKHLTECPACREGIVEWKSFERGVRSWAETQKVAPVSMLEAEELIRRAESRNPHGGRTLRRGVVLGGGLAASAAAAALVFAVLVLEGNPPDAPTFEANTVSPQKAVVTGLSERPVELEKGASLEAPEMTHVKAKIGKDTVAVSSNGRVRLLDLDRKRVRLGLESGTVACRVDKRKGRGDFVVEAGDYAVKVVGTRFQVTRQNKDLSVLVQEGAVKVESRDGETWMLRNGDALHQHAGKQPTVTRANAEALTQMNELFELPIPSPTPMPEVVVDSHEDKDQEPEMVTEPSGSDAILEERVEMSELKTRPVNRRGRTNITAELPKWRKWVVNGRNAEAIQEMKAYLQSKSSDGRVWALLGDASRKARDWDGAQHAYKRSIALGGPDAGRSMYMLASLLQTPLGRHREALELFREYKASGRRVTSKLSELTDVNIARSLVALGRCNEAKKSVARLLEFEGSIIAKNAQKMVERCGRTEASSSNENE